MAKVKRRYEGSVVESVISVLLFLGLVFLGSAIRSLLQENHAGHNLAAGYWLLALPFLLIAFWLGIILREHRGKFPVGVVLGATFFLGMASLFVYATPSAYVKMGVLGSAPALLGAALALYFLGRCLGMLPTKKKVILAVAMLSVIGAVAAAVFAINASGWSGRISCGFAAVMFVVIFLWGLRVFFSEPPGERGDASYTTVKPV